MLDRNGFAGVMAYIAAGVGKDVSANTAEVYYDLLGDLPLPVLQVAAKRALLEGKYPVFPTIGQLREFASNAIGEGEAMHWAAAWELARKHAAVLACELDILGREPTYIVQKRLLDTLPEAVVRAGTAIGWREIAEPTNVVATRAHFRGAYEVTIDRYRRDAILPMQARTQIRSCKPAKLAREESRDDVREARIGEIVSGLSEALRAPGESVCSAGKRNGAAIPGSNGVPYSGGH